MIRRHIYDASLEGALCKMKSMFKTDYATKRIEITCARCQRLLIKKMKIIKEELNENNRVVRELSK